MFFLDVQEAWQYKEDQEEWERTNFPQKKQLLGSKPHMGGWQNLKSKHKYDVTCELSIDKMALGLTQAVDKFNKKYCPIEAFLFYFSPTFKSLI